jgi:hypothetical protein
MAQQVNMFSELRDRVLQNNGVIPAEKRAMFWFRDYASALNRFQLLNKGTSFSQLAYEERSRKNWWGAVEPGFLYFYMYDPKWKNELPYYDLFPFTLVINDYPDRFLGLNFHYLDYYHRAIFFDALYPLRQGRASRPDVRDIRMRLKVTYDILKSARQYRYFKPTIKMYLKRTCKRRS